MKLFSKFIFILIPGLFSLSAFAQNMDQDAMMEAWQKSMVPGPEHKMIANMVGEWDAEITMWTDPSQPPEITKGAAVYESIFDGRYIIGYYDGITLGMPFSGMNISGYDNVKKVFFSSLINNMGTGVMYLEGTYDKNSNTYNYSRETLDPMENKMKVREVITIIDKDHSKFEMFVNMGNDEMKSMEINYSRKS
ncbi:MAG: DUF1579 domain-containing protein [Ignavibacteriaceae bacterium]